MSSNDYNYFLEKCAFNILKKVEKQIGEHLVKTFSKLELKWSCVRNSLAPYNFEVTISFSIKKLFQFKNAQNPPQALKHILEEKIILNVGGKQYETLRSILTAQPETLLGVMFQDRNKNLRHPVNGNEYFFDRNCEIFTYIMEFYQIGKISWPIEFEKSTKITYKQLEQELDYFQIPYNKSTTFCSLALGSAIRTYRQLILAFEELIIYCCENLISEISLYISLGKIEIDHKELSLSINSFKMNAYDILTYTTNQLGDHLSKTFYKLKPKWNFERRKERKSRYLYICISLSIEQGLTF